jgi:hypothetical protein
MVEFLQYEEEFEKYLPVNPLKPLRLQTSLFGSLQAAALSNKRGKLFLGVSSKWYAVKKRFLQRFCVFVTETKKRKNCWPQNTHLYYHTLPIKIKKNGSWKESIEDSCSSQGEFCFVLGRGVNLIISCPRNSPSPTKDQRRSMELRASTTQLMTWYMSRAQLLLEILPRSEHQLLLELY